MNNAYSINRNTYHFRNKDIADLDLFLDEIDRSKLGVMDRNEQVDFVSRFINAWRSLCKSEAHNPNVDATDIDFNDLIDVDDNMLLDDFLKQFDRGD